MSSERPIIHILPAEPFGGLQALVIDLARAQRATGKMVTVILLAPSDRVEARCRSAGITPVVLNGPKLSRMITLQRKLQRVGPAILHSHCEPIWASILLALRARFWVFHVHVYPLHKSMRDRLTNFIRYHRTRRFIAITKSIEQSFIEEGLASAERLSVVYNGMDMASLPPPEARNAQGPLTVGFVGRAVREKGLFDFIETADLLRDHADIRFVIAGEGSDLPEARAVIAERGLEDRISVLGFVDDMHSVWRDLDLFLMLSTREPFGLVILEAIAAGVGVLGYDIPSGGSEIMAAIPGCHMVPAFSTKALAETVLEISRDRASLSNLVTAGRAVIDDRFSLRRMEEGVAAAYQRLS